jgi:uncharacterized protein (DUF362 family)
MPDVYLYQSEKNSIVESLSALFTLMELDPHNPLGCLLSTGQTVLIMPSADHHCHQGGKSLSSVITDPMLVRALCDYIFLAIGKCGRIIVGCAPTPSANWSALLRNTGLDELPVHYRSQGYRIVLADLRTIAVEIDTKGRPWRHTLPGDPHGYLHVQPEGRYRVAGSLLEADAVINLPKLKTHTHSGLSGGLENMRGILAGDSGDINTSGVPARAYFWNRWSLVPGWLRKRAFGRAGTDLLAAEGASGESTASRWDAILDANRIALYADRNGLMQDRQQRRVLTIVDAFIAGQGEGPLAPDPVELCCLVAGSEPVAVEVVSARLARWPASQLGHLDRAFGEQHYPLANYPLESIEIHSAPASLERLARRLRPSRSFETAQPEVSA